LLDIVKKYELEDKSEQTFDVSHYYTKLNQGGQNGLN
jgi:hypothetical protein